MFPVVATAKSHYRRTVNNITARNRKLNLIIKIKREQKIKFNY